MSSLYRGYAHEYARGHAGEYAGSLGLSITAHGVVLVLMMTSFAIVPRQAQQPLQLAVEATLIDMSEIRRRAEEQERQQQMELDKQRKAEKERQLIAARKKEEQRRKQEAARLAEQKRSEEAEKTRKQQIADAERLEKERQAAEKAAEIAREEASIAAAEKKRRQVLEAEMQQQLAVEEKRLAARESGLLAQYEAIIRQKIHRNWVIPASARGDLVCEVHVTQIPGGEVVGVRMGKCNGDAAVVRSIEAAVFRASPLPVPPDPSLFDRNIRFTFRPQQ